MSDKKPWEETWTLGEMTLRGSKIPTIQINEGVSINLMKETYAIKPWTEFDICPHATLMAAAPDLYRVIQRLLDAIDQANVETDFDLNRAIDDGNSALKKARGEK